MNGVRRIPREERDESKDHAAPIPGTQLGNLEALEKNIERVLADIRELKHEVLANKPVTRRKTVKSVPSIVTLLFAVFPPEYAE